jgi:hypothetical protein
MSQDIKEVENKSEVSTDTMNNNILEKGQIQKEFSQNGYVKVPNIICKELVEIAGVFAYNIARIEGPSKTDTQVENTPSFANNNLMGTIQSYLKPKIEEFTGLELLPTYTYFRVYKKGDILARHKDRASCEVSLTLCLRKKSDEDNWPIYIENKDYKLSRGTPSNTPDDAQKNQAKVELEPGDGLIYRGCECEHWREEYTEGTKLAQVFIHYVDANGPNKEWVYDKTPDRYFPYDK